MITIEYLTPTPIIKESLNDNDKLTELVLPLSVTDGVQKEN